jgi:hypothetical protein
MDILLVYGKLASLSESFCAPVDTANEGFSASMCVFVFFQVLRQCECLLTVLTHMLLEIEVLEVVPLERKLT